MKSWHAFGTLARGHVDQAGLRTYETQFGTYDTQFSKLPYAL